MLEPPCGLQTVLPKEDMLEATIPLEITLLGIVLNR